MTTLQEAARKALKALEVATTPLAKDRQEVLTAMYALRTALAQQGEQQPVCHGCGIPAGDVHMSTCKSGKWPSRVSNGDTAAPAPQPAQGEPVYQYQMADGSWIDQIKDSYDYNRKYATNATVRVVYTAAPAPQSQEPTAWRTEALKWIRRKAEDQRATNEQNPRHAEAYPSWGEMVRQWHWLADELELEQNSTSFGFEPYQEPAPQPASEPVAGLNRSYTEQLINALHENSDPVSIDAAEEFQRLLAAALAYALRTAN